MFQLCGKIVDGGVRLVRNYATKVIKRFAYAEFKNLEGPVLAVNRGDGWVRGGCYVDSDEGAVKGSFRGMRSCVKII